MSTVDKYVEKYGAVADLVSSKKEFIVKQIINTTLLLVILGAFGCFDWMHLQFHFEYLSDASFWFNVVIKAIADICAYNIGINVIVDEVIKKNTTLQKLKSIYNELNNYKDEDFEEYINKYNRECKIEAYINEINFKIVKLNKFSRKSDKLLYSSKAEDKQELKKINRYCIKRQQLEDLKTDTYIEANIDNLEVKYKDVDAGIFDLEINGTQKIVQNKVTGSINKGRVITSATTLLGILAGTIFVNSFRLTPNTQELEDGVVAAMNYAIKMITDIGLILWQFLRGVLTTPRIVSQQLTNPLEERVKILKKYYTWRRSNGKTVPQYFLDLVKEPVKEEYIEVTEEQLKKLTEEGEI